MPNQQQEKQQETMQGDGHPPAESEGYGVPQPPDIEKRWTFTKVQKIGVPLLILIPLLALFGVFGESVETVTETGDTFAVEITYPTRFRYKMVHATVVVIENISEQTVPTVTVSFDEEYISQFSGVTFTPSPSEITEEAYYVQLTDLEAGEERQVVVEVQAERYWMQEGTIAVLAGEVGAVEDVAIEVSTLVYP